ncbi:MAG: transposase, partial [Planctomycetia bacterium]|nr:transposase [Planctomycetia bacterium]
MVFAVETACDLWQPLVHYLYVNGYLVVRVSPLSTYHSRVQIGNDFSRTYPKDALIIASNASNGSFVLHSEDDPTVRSMRNSSITSDKLRKGMVQNKNRIVSFVKRYFPEFIKGLNPETLTARYLLKKYFLPQHYLALDIEEETKVIMEISKSQHGKETLLNLQQMATKTIGVSCTDAIEEKSLHLTLNCWLSQL